MNGTFFDFHYFVLYADDVQAYSPKTHKYKLYFCGRSQLTFSVILEYNILRYFVYKE